MSRRFRLPLPTIDWLSAEKALRVSRIRRPVVLGRATARLDPRLDVVAEPGKAELVDAETVEAADAGDAELPEAADGVVWLPESDELDLFDQPDVVEAFRRRLGDRRLLVIVSPDIEQRAVRGLSDEGFALLRYDHVRQESGARSVWLLTQPDGYRIRTCGEDDVDAILELFAPLFHVARTPEHWRWKYLDNPWGKLWISLVETEDGELAAHYAGYPVPFVYWPSGASGARQDLLAEQIGDTMTVPAHRKVGVGWSSLLGRALRRHFAVFGHGRVDFYYGINNSKIRAFNLRIVGSRWLGSAGYRRRPARPTGERIPRGHAVERIEPFDERFRAGDDGSEAAEFDQLLDRAGPHYKLLIRKDSEWLRWRYAVCPDQPPFFALAARRGEQLVGWAVFRPPTLTDESGGRTLRLVDALFDPEHTHCLGPLLDEALRQPEAAGGEEVACWFPPRPEWWVQALHDVGFERVAEPHDLGFIYLPFDRQDTDEIIFDYCYAWGDSDLT